LLNGDVKRATAHLNANGKRQMSMRVLSSFGNELTKKALKAMFEGGN
jgi:fructose-bisphosphate aldolase class 1